MVNKLLIQTNQSIFSDQQEIVTNIAKYWNDHSDLWKDVWGPHIHHGYYQSLPQTSSSLPQEVLIDKLIEKLKLTAHQKLLDVGCGMGETAIYLSQRHKIDIIGITLSTKQLTIAQNEAKNRLAHNVSFQIEDALSLKNFPDNTFDIVWSLESCEQFGDKALFLQQAYRVLKPGGKLMIATWCSEKEQYEGEKATDYINLCQTFFVPYMPTIDFYSHLLAQNFTILYVEDWSENVKQSWQIGISKLNTYSYFKIFKLAGFSAFKSLRNIHLLSDAFESGKIRYGVFIARKC